MRRKPLLIVAVSLAVLAAAVLGVRFFLWGPDQTPAAALPNLRVEPSARPAPQASDIIPRVLSEIESMTPQEQLDYLALYWCAAQLVPEDEENGLGRVVRDQVEPVRALYRYIARQNGEDPNIASRASLEFCAEGYSRDEPVG